MKHTVKQSESESEMHSEEQLESNKMLKQGQFRRKRKRLNVQKWKVLTRKKNTVFLHLNGKRLWSLFSM